MFGSRTPDTLRVWAVVVDGVLAKCGTRLNELPQQRRRVIACGLCRKMEAGFAVLFGEPGSPLRSAGQFRVQSENHCCIRVSDVPVGAL
jgi:hypothetical protein